MVSFVNGGEMGCLVTFGYMLWPLVQYVMSRDLEQQLMDYYTTQSKSIIIIMNQAKFKLSSCSSNSHKLSVTTESEKTPPHV